MQNINSNNTTYYWVIHISFFEDSTEFNHESIKTIGIYESESLAQIAISRLREQPGFCDEPLQFMIEPFMANKNYWEYGFQLTESQVIDPPYKPQNIKCIK